MRRLDSISLSLHGCCREGWILLLSLSKDPDEKFGFCFSLSSWILLRRLGSTSFVLHKSWWEGWVLFLSLFMVPVEKDGFYLSLSLSLSPWILLSRLGSTSIWRRLGATSLFVYLFRRLGSISLSGPSVLCCVRSVYSPSNLDSWVLYLDN